MEKIEDKAAILTAKLGRAEYTSTRGENTTNRSSGRVQEKDVPRVNQ